MSGRQTNGHVSVHRLTSEGRKAVLYQGRCLTCLVLTATRDEFMTSRSVRLALILVGRKNTLASCHRLSGKLRILLNRTMTNWAELIRLSPRLQLTSVPSGTRVLSAICNLRSLRGLCHRLLQLMRILARSLRNSKALRTTNHFLCVIQSELQRIGVRTQVSHRVLLRLLSRAHFQTFTFPLFLKVCVRVGLSIMRAYHIHTVIQPTNLQWSLAGLQVDHRLPTRLINRHGKFVRECALQWNHASVGETLIRLQRGLTTRRNRTPSACNDCRHNRHSHPLLANITPIRGASQLPVSPHRRQVVFLARLFLW